MLNRPIPSTNEALPVIGLGTWQSFDKTSSGLAPLRKLLSDWMSEGGRLIDSSPMYGRSEEVIGTLTGSIDDPPLFFATKVWTRGREKGIRQMEDSFLKMKREKIDLLQIHNLVDWEIHIDTLRRWKEEGRIRYLGITHYTDSMHESLENIMRSTKIDFVQFNYSIMDRHAENSLLPAARELGVATIINRPFGEGSLFSAVRNKKLPEWAADLGIESWSQFFLKYIISHPAVTCVIPATANPEHMADNLKAGRGTMPDEPTRKKMAELIKNL